MREESADCFEGGVARVMRFIGADAVNTGAAEVGSGATGSEAVGSRSVGSGEVGSADWKEAGNSTRDVVRQLRAVLEERRRVQLAESGCAVLSPGAVLSPEAGFSPDGAAFPAPIRTGWRAVDEVLPGGGLAYGSVVECLRPATVPPSAREQPVARGSRLAMGVGVTQVALRVAQAAATRTGPDGFRELRPILWIDPRGEFYPPAAAALGVDLERLLVVQPGDASSALWAADEGLRCRALGAVVAFVGEMDAACSRRMQLAAESGGGLGILVRPAQTRGRSFAAVRMLIEPVPAGAARSSVDVVNPNGRFSSSRRSVRLTLVRVREGKPAGPFVVELSDEAGFVSAPAAVVDRAPAGRCRQAVG